ncbi:MAG: hypothetical protein A2010_01625 [Nitrospirae bacterium GWD2_57_9]|nr:MAG: hypothetical protein A2010_01625 [Nitrospirae bacterium GWD2_57_9]OGW51274.1 MAG: hypothetical protein A2078_00955 [Nitrospirae bacterium GWC2_57_9]
MEKNVLWTPWVDPGLEHLRMARISKGINADGMIVGIKDNVPFRAHYKVRGDSAWRLQQVEIYLLDDSSEDIKMHADGRGHWTDDSGAPLPFLDGCVDMDISATPFTNTLAIQRLGLKPGETAALPVVYVAVPEMEIKLARQRYTCLERSVGGGLYKYEDEGLFSGFTADLRVDADGLVIDYPGLFRRVWSG